MQISKHFRLCWCSCSISRSCLHFSHSPGAWQSPSTISSITIHSPILGPDSTSRRGASDPGACPGRSAPRKSLSQSKPEQRGAFRWFQRRWEHPCGSASWLDGPWGAGVGGQEEGNSPLCRRGGVCQGDLDRSEARRGSGWVPLKTNLIQNACVNNSQKHPDICGCTVCPRGKRWFCPLFIQNNRIQYMHVTRKNKLNNSVCNEACHTFNFT